MRDIIIVGIGSMLGGAARHMINQLVLSNFQDQRFPLATLAVNIIGCFLAGLFVGINELGNMQSQGVRLFMMTGILGGFTTFSAFGHETIFLLRNDRTDLAIINIALSVIAGLSAVWLGTKIVK